MAIIYACSFDHYGEQAGGRSGDVYSIGDNSLLGDGWSDTPSGGRIQDTTLRWSIGIPPWGARSGKMALGSDSYANTSGLTQSVTLSNPTQSVALAIPGVSKAKRIIHFAFSMDTLPTHEWGGNIIEFCDGGRNTRARLSVLPTGRLMLADGGLLTRIASGLGTPTNPNILLTSAAPVIQAATWYFLSIEITNTGGFTCYVGDIIPANLVLQGNGLALTDSDPNSPDKNIDILNFLPASFLADLTTRYVRDIVICDDTGTYNNTLLGECFVSAQEMRMEEPGGGWEANPRQMVAGGIFRTRRPNPTNVSYLRFADHASTELGANDFTAEGWVRFSSIPQSSDVWNLLAKWFTSSANRSWRLVYYGSDKTLRWEVSTNGSAGIIVKQVPWEPILHRWHHVAVSRESGVTRLFIDGFEMGVGTADANTYFNGTAYLGVGCRFQSTGNSAVAAESFDGFMDEIRVTNGVSRYNADFVPATVPFGRNTTDDPDFLSVGLLLGFDNNDNVDESQYSHQPLTGTPPEPPPPLNPEDGDYTFRVLNGAPPIDDTYIEAPLTRATGVFTFLGLPTAAEEIDINGTVYTWVASVSSAYDVAIGADVNACIDNLVSAINADAGAGTKYGTGTLAHPDVAADSHLSPQVVLTATAVGSAGNAVTTTTTMLDGKFREPTLSGGKDIPTPSEFAIERLPVDVTGILGVQMTTRAYKTDAGTASMRIDLVGPGGGVAQGDDYSPDLNPQWGRQIFEEDPDTSAGLTPSTMIGGRARFVRTV